MERYLLYRSGIHDATVKFSENGVYYIQRDVMANQWLDEVELTESKAEKLDHYYHINPIMIDQRMAAYRNAFETDKGQITLPWGAVYQKYQESPLIWAERKKQYPLDVVVVEGAPVAFISPSRENCSMLVKAGFESYTPLQLWKRENVSRAEHAIEHKGTFMVPMQDGIKLATEVWLPEDVNAAAPVIMARTPYGRRMYDYAYVNFLERGYGVVIQDTRGRQDSEGEWIPMSTEIEDGNDTLNWIADQSWCDGNIGMIGASYGGFVQWAAAASGNPYLKALISIVTAGSPFIDIPRKGGAFVSGMLAWAFAVAEKEFKPDNMVRSDWEEVLNIRPLRDILKQALGIDVPFWDKWMAHSANDTFWQQADWHQYKDNMKAPAMIVSGWYDDNGMGTTQALDAVSGYAPEDKKVILGPWMHNANTTRDIQGVALGNNALRYDLDLMYQRWFDRKLKHMNNDMNQEPRVEYYVTGANTWETNQQWPPESSEWTNIYVTSSGDARGADGDGELTFKESTYNQHDAFVYDPDNPAPHLIDMSENEVGVPANYREVDKRHDVLVYDSLPLKDPLTIAGDVSVTLYASSSAKDTDWVVRLMDVDSNGNPIKLADGVLRARFRKGFEEEVLLEPGKIEEYVIRTSKIANTFLSGHRIRLTITSSAENFIFPNTNTGDDPAVDVNWVQAHQKVYHGPQYPTLVQLPVLQ